MAAWVTVVFLEVAGSHIETHDSTFDIKIRNVNYCPVFRSELIAIYKGLKFIDTASDLAFKDIWILTDSRASTQYLSHWTTVGDMTSLNILDVVWFDFLLDTLFTFNGSPPILD
ncbi:uncharacterized protein TNCV_183391 [Trichonephila clavipes]|nr:uncharacterized protein TNCV_183391 [Trichonephila clavipes]